MNKITARKRDPAAKAKHLRRSGFVPCFIYGAALAESLCVRIDLTTA